MLGPPHLNLGGWGTHSLTHNSLAATRPEVLNTEDSSSSLGVTSPSPGPSHGLTQASPLIFLTGPK